MDHLGYEPFMASSFSIVAFGTLSLSSYTYSAYIRIHAMYICIHIYIGPLIFGCSPAISSGNVAWMVNSRERECIMICIRIYFEGPLSLASPIDGCALQVVLPNPDTLSAGGSAPRLWSPATLKVLLLMVEILPEFM